MRALIVFALIAATGSAHAQDPDPYPQPPPSPYPQPPPPQPYAPPPVQPGYGQPMPVQLTVDEHSLLLKGEITQQQQLGGAVANAFLGFGIGQAIQGRWSDTGWIFTLGQGASIALMIGAAVQAVESCNSVEGDCNGGLELMVAGALGFTVFYIWGIVDAVTGPATHNRKVRELRMRLGIPQPMYTRVVPYVNKTRDGGGGTAGLVLRF